jgi:hypothetical protein
VEDSSYSTWYAQSPWARNHKRGLSFTHGEIHPYSKLTPPWPPPLISGPYPLCELCSYSFREMTPPESRFTLKFRNRSCWKHAPGIPQEAPDPPLSLLDRLQAGELPKAFPKAYGRFWEHREAGSKVRVLEFSHDRSYGHFRAAFFVNSGAKEPRLELRIK